MIVREVGARDPKARVRDKRAQYADDQVPLLGAPERLERPVELLPTSREGPHALLGDRHVGLERARRDPCVVIVVDAHSMLGLRFPIGLKRDLARDVTIDVGEKNRDERAGQKKFQLVGGARLGRGTQPRRGDAQQRANAIDDLVGEGAFAHFR